MKGDELEQKEEEVVAGVEIDTVPACRWTKTAFELVDSRGEW